VATRAVAGGVALTMESNANGGRELSALPLCRSLVEAHGGRISAVARPEGGTRLVVWLPLPPDGR